LADTIEPARKFKFNRPATGEPPISTLFRDLFEALARTNYTTDADFPLVATSKDGMLRVSAVDPNNIKLDVFIDGTWRTFIQNAQLGFAAPAKKIIEKTDAETVWTIDHNLGSQPLVQVFSPSYIQRQAVPSAPGANQYILQHTTPNRVVVTNPAPATGFVVLIG
jgi:hypothetical protein